MGSPDESPVMEPKTKARFLTLFNVVSFKNDACQMGTEHGVCMTKSECSNAGGQQIGNCAAGITPTYPLPF